MSACWSDCYRTSADTTPPLVDDEPYTHSREKTANCGIHLHVMNSNRFFELSERPIPVKVLTWMRDSNSQLLEWKLLLSPCIHGWLVSGCSLGTPASLRDHLLCHLLTGYSKLKDSWSNVLPPLSEGYVNEHVLFSFMTDGKGSRCVYHK
jgi:hypothetical protein